MITAASSERRLTIDRFAGMGTEIEVQHCGDAAVGRGIRLLFLQAEAVASRFLGDSELSRWNRGHVDQPSPLLAAMLAAAHEMRERSRGLFDPCLLQPLMAAGYGGSFDHQAAHPARGESRIAGEFDLGGIAKGFIAERAADMAATACIVDAGGDIALRGVAPGQDAWYVGVQDPWRPAEDALLLRLTGPCGVATSSVRRRAWLRHGRWAHHIIDPRTRRPAVTDLVAATVIAPTATEAEAFAKAALIAGSGAATGLLASEKLAGVLFLADGSHRLAGPIESMLA